MIRIVVTVLLVMLASACGGGGSGTPTPVSAYSGVYSGEFVGSDVGTWSVTSAANGVICGYAYSETYAVGFTLFGRLADGGSLDMRGSAASGAVFSGAIAIDGTDFEVDGTWANDALSGTFAGLRDGAIEEATVSETVIGTWGMPYTDVTMTMLANGTWTSDDGSEVLTGTYTVTGDSLVTTFDNGDPSLTYTVGFCGPYLWLQDDEGDHLVWLPPALLPVVPGAS